MGIPVSEADLYGRLKSYRLDHGFPWFGAPFDLNLLVLRSGVVVRWDDQTCWAFLDDAGREWVEVFAATGDAWDGEWTTPSHPAGCAYVVDQHVRAGWKVGLHKGRRALVQVAPFEFVRWPPGSGRVPTVAELEALPRQSAVRGFNLHNRVTGRTPAKVATDDSKSCTVHLFHHQHLAALELVAQQAARGHGDTVSVTFAQLAAVL